MSDGDSVSGILKDLGKETAKQVFLVPKNIATGAISQVVGQNSEEENAEKKAQRSINFQRIKEIEAEMAQIAIQNERKTGPEIIKSQQQGEQQIKSPDTQKVSESTRQAVGRAEQGRNFKG